MNETLKERVDFQIISAALTLVALFSLPASAFLVWASQGQRYIDTFDDVIIQFGVSPVPSIFLVMSAVILLAAPFFKGETVGKLTPITNLVLGVLQLIGVVWATFRLIDTQSQDSYIGENSDLATWASLFNYTLPLILAGIVIWLSYLLITNKPEVAIADEAPELADEE